MSTSSTPTPETSKEEKPLDRYTKRELIGLMCDARAQIKRWESTYGLAKATREELVAERDAAARDATAARGELASEKLGRQEAERLSSDRYYLLELARVRLRVMTAGRDLARAERDEIELEHLNAQKARDDALAARVAALEIKTEPQECS